MAASRSALVGGRNNCATIAFFAKSACNPLLSVLGERLAGDQSLQRAPVAQLDRAPDYESGGQRFESFRARHFLSVATYLATIFTVLRLYATYSTGDFIPGSSMVGPFLHVNITFSGFGSPGPR